MLPYYSAIIPLLLCSAEQRNLEREEQNDIFNIDVEKIKARLVFSTMIPILLPGYHSRWGPDRRSTIDNTNGEDTGELYALWGPFRSQ